MTHSLHSPHHAFQLLPPGRYLQVSHCTTHLSTWFAFNIWNNRRFDSTLTGKTCKSRLWFYFIAILIFTSSLKHNPQETIEASTWQTDWVDIPCLVSCLTLTPPVPCTFQGLREYETNPQSDWIRRSRADLFSLYSHSSASNSEARLIQVLTRILQQMCSGVKEEEPQNMGINKRLDISFRFQCPLRWKWFFSPILDHLSLQYQFIRHLQPLGIYLFNHL